MNGSKLLNFKTLILATLAAVLIVIVVAGFIAHDNVLRLTQDLDAISRETNTPDVVLRVNKMRHHFHSSYATLLATSATVMALFSIVVLLVNASVVTRQREEIAQDVVLRVSKVLAGNLNFDKAVSESLRVMCDHLRCQVGAFWTLDEKTQLYACRNFYSNAGFPEFEKVTREGQLAKGRGLPGRVWQQCIPVWISDLSTDTNFPRVIEASRDGLRSGFAFPMTAGGRILGVFEFFTTGIVRENKDFLSAFAIVGNELGQSFERQRVESELHTSERRFREFASVVDECFFVSSPTLTEHYYVSPGYEKIWGYPVEDAYRDPTQWAQSILPEHKHRVVDYVQRLGNVERPETEIEYPIYRRDGSIAWLSARVFRIQQEDGGWHSCGTVRDITERRQLEQRVSEFYTMVSHELRTPLTSIKGSLLLLERGKAGTLSDRASELIHLSRRECDRVIRLVNDMLDMKKIEAGKLMLVRQVVDPADLVSQTLQVMAPLAAERKVHLKQDVQTGDAVYADKDLIVQVITNLIANATKFSPEDGDILVSADAVEGNIRFSVKDAGPGIDKVDQEHLFKAFSQIPGLDGTAPEGSGLGLAICKGIVDAHGGKIGVDSEAGQGATFWFELARATPEQLSPDSSKFEELPEASSQHD